MRKRIEALFEKEYIFDTAILPLSECRVTLPRLLARKDFTPQSVILFLIPYFHGFPENISAYAAAEDYHLFVKELYERIGSALASLMPTYRFWMFADHSPIDERHAAVRAGLGVFGKNGLLLTEKYSSFQFIGEIITDAPTELLGEVTLSEMKGCLSCGKCLSSCPTGILRGEGEDCLSAITQRKGDLTEENIALMRKENTAWGCDACQRCCPYTERALKEGTIYTPIPFFRENRIEALTPTVLSAMDEETFRRRAFAWRGRKTAERNAAILANGNRKANEK